MDLTGGLDPDREFVLASAPADPEMRESVNAWVWDDGTGFGLPRLGVEAVGEQWDTPDIQVNIALAGGRVVTMFQAGEAHPPRGEDGRPRVLGSGPLHFELVEPFGHWRAQLQGTGTGITVEDQLAGWFPGGDGTAVPVELEIDLRSAVPPWEVGTLLEEAGRILATQEEGDLMAAPATSSSSGPPAGSGWATRSTRCPAAACASVAPACAAWPPSGAMPGSRRCSPAVGPSAACSTRRATTASPP